jgi:hypothetical protein
MRRIDLTRQDIPLWSQGSGTWTIQLAVDDLTKPIEPSDLDLFSTSFQIGGEDWKFGGANSVKFGIDAGTSVRIVPLWKTSGALRKKLLEEYRMESYLDAHADEVLLVLQIGAQAEAHLAAKFKYSLLSSTATVKAGVDGACTLIRAYPANRPGGELVRDLFKALRLPCDVESLAPGEVIAFEYGGYLDFTGRLGAGYEISGSPSFTLGQLQLTEKYDFSVAARLSLQASLAGRFRVMVSNGDEAGWARVKVHRSRRSDLGIAADVKVAASLDTQGIPGSADDFLSAVLGLKARNWVNMFAQVRTLTDFPSLERYLDNLAKSFIEEYIGKGFDTLAQRTQLDEFLARVNKITDSYVNLGNHAIAIFDRHYDPVAKKVDNRLMTALDKIKAVTSWDSLKGDIDPTLWELVQQLTEGDPLGWMLGEIAGKPVKSPAATLVDLKARVDDVLALIRDEAHGQIRQLIALAKEKFPLEGFITELNDITWTRLKAEPQRRLTGFVERILGQEIARLGNSDLGLAVTRFHQALDAIETFKINAFDKFREALDQSFQFNLQAAYKRSTNEETLLDFELNMNQAEGRRLMQQAGHGRFQDVLGAFESGVVKLHAGTLTHQVTRETRVRVNIVGWHTDWHYAGLDRLLVASDQQITVSGDGHLVVFTSLDLQKERERKRNEERVATNLLLRFFGESNGKLDFDGDSGQYLIDAITRLTAKYNLVFNDPMTTSQELAQYLSFADDFGLAANEDALITQLEAQLPTDAQGGFGATTITYDVRFTIEGLNSLFRRPFTSADAAFVRRTMRLTVLANYLRKNPTLAKRAWCYWSQRPFLLWSQQGPGFTNVSERSFPIDPSPFRNLQAPGHVALPRTELFQLSTLYSIETSMVEGLRQLTLLLQSPGKLKPRDFESALRDFGKALSLYDNFDEGENTVFALLDQLIRRVGGAQRKSSMTIVAKAGNQSVRQTLIA